MKEQLITAIQMANDLHNILHQIGESTQFDNMIFAKDSCCEIMEYLEAENEGYSLNEQEE